MGFMLGAALVGFDCSLTRFSDCREFPKIGKDPVREPEGHGELKFFLQRITDGTDPLVSGWGDPPFKPGPKGGGHDRIIAPVQNLAWIVSQLGKRSEMGDLRESGEISVQVRKGFSHLVELIEVVSIPWQGWRAAMGCDDIYSTLERQTESFDTLEISAVGGQRELAPGMRQERKFQSSHALPERLVNWTVTINRLHTGKEFQEDGAGISTTLKFGEGIGPGRVN